MANGDTHTRTREHKTDLNLGNVWLELQLVHLESLKQHFFESIYGHKQHSSLGLQFILSDNKDVVNTLLFSRVHQQHSTVR